MSMLADLSGFHEYDALRTAQWDSLEKALTVYRTPNNGQHRRVDLICALPETYWTAVVGWTGGTMFQRDLRMAAKSVYVRCPHFPLNPIKTLPNFFFPLWARKRTKV
jgi:hypothetical protein